MRKFRGQGVVVLRPRTTEEVSAIMRYCNEKRLAVCTQGGNTGLVGGGVPLHDEVILSTELMKNVVRYAKLNSMSPFTIFTNHINFSASLSFENKNRI